MKIVYLSPDMTHYGGAMYQQDVIEELPRHAVVFFYGRGFPDYDPQDSLRDVITKAGFQPDWLVAGHAWLTDRDGRPAERRYMHPRVDLATSAVPKAILFNKEYANLTNKLAYVRAAGFDVGFTHHHEPWRLQEATGVPFHFWPFAVDHRRFHPGEGAKTYDLGFSGNLQNPGRQSDLRLRLMRELFWCVRDIPVTPRRDYRRIRFFWNAAPRDRFSRMLNRWLRRYERLGNTRYARAIRDCRGFVCTRSPADLIGPRYFECMASRTLVFAERNAGHAQVFGRGRLVEFASVAEFVDLLRAYLVEGGVERAGSMLDAAYHDVLAKHTWTERVRQMLAVLEGVVVAS